MIVAIKRNCSGSLGVIEMGVELLHRATDPRIRGESPEIATSYYFRKERPRCQGHVVVPVYLNSEGTPYQVQYSYGWSPSPLSVPGDQVLHPTLASLMYRAKPHATMWYLFAFLKRKSPNRKVAVLYPRTERRRAPRTLHLAGTNPKLSNSVLCPADPAMTHSSSFG